jgi:hypothetical protein
MFVVVFLNIYLLIGNQLIKLVKLTEAPLLTLLTSLTLFPLKQYLSGIFVYG